MLEGEELDAYLVATQLSSSLVMTNRIYQADKSEKWTSAENKVVEASENILSNLTSIDWMQND